MFSCAQQPEFHLYLNYMNEYIDMGMMKLTESYDLNLCKSITFFPEVNYLDMWIVDAGSHSSALSATVVNSYTTLQFNLNYNQNYREQLRIVKNVNVLGLLDVEYQVRYDPNSPKPLGEKEYQAKVDEAHLCASKSGTIKHIWNSLLKDINPQEFGNILFKNMFIVIPDATALFKTISKENDVYSSSKFKAHGLKFAQMFGNAVSLLDEMDRLVKSFTDLGVKHISYQVKPEHFPMVGLAFFMTLESLLGESYTVEVANCYSLLYHYLAELMINGGDLRNR